MGRQIIKQEDGRYAIWSSVVDNFIYINADLGELKKIYEEEAKKRAMDQLERALERLESGWTTQFTKTMDSAFTIVEQQHGFVGLMELLDDLYGSKNKK